MVRVGGVDEGRCLAAAVCLCGLLEGEVKGGDGTVNIVEYKLYIQTGKVKPCSKQLLANPKAEICAFHGGTWVRIAGELIEDHRLEVVVRPEHFDKIQITSPEVNRPGLALAGFYEIFEAERIQLIGKAETQYLNSLDASAKRLRHLARVAASRLRYCSEMVTAKTARSASQSK